MDDKKLLKSITERDSSGGRLQSLKVPRDLSLGLIKTKKHHAPNLNVVRNKDKTKEFLKKMEQKRNVASNKDKQHHHKNDNKTQYIQSTGIFSQGTADVRRLSDKRVSFRDSTKGTSSSPALVKSEKPNWNANKTDASFLDLDGDIEYNDEDEFDDNKSSYQPLCLDVETDNNKDVTRNELVKKEEEVENRGVQEPFNKDDFYSDDSPALSLVKLPDSFAGKGLSDDPNCKQLFDYPLSGMLEGQIGKLLIRKSGKMQVHIGNMKYELIPNETSESKEELATIVQSNEGGCSIAILGEILNNFIMFPDYDEL